MGNVPNRWAGRGLALALGLLFAAGGFLLGQFAGDRLANGFTFDWFVHPGGARFGSAEVLTAAGLAAATAALLSVVLVVGPVGFLVRGWMARLRYTPPRYSAPVGLDVLTGRLVVLFSVAAGGLAALLGYVVLASPMAQGGQPIAQLSAYGYAVFVAWAGALGAGMAAFFAALSTFSGIVSGKLVRKSDRNLIARVSLFGVRHAKATVAVITIATLVAGYYATALTTNVDVADVLPRGDPNTDAAHNLTDKFKSSFTQQVTFQFRVLDMDNRTQAALYEKESGKIADRRTEPDPNNITDELYIRAMSETIGWVLGHPPFTGTVGGPDFYKLINWTVAGGATQQNTAGNASFSLPDTSPAGELQYRSVHEGVVNVGAVYQAVDAVTSPNWTQMAILVLVDPKSDVTTKEIGEAALQVRDEWVEYARSHPEVYKVFGEDNPPQFSVDLPIANAHASELTKRDFTLLLPIIAVFIAVTLFIAFRSFINVFITFSMLAIAVTWTLGLMGGAGIALNTLNLAVVPLIMGIGIDYGIHMMNEYQELRHQGKTQEEAWAYAGGGSALALFVCTLTTVSGLLVMVVSPSLLVAQLGALSAIAIVTCLVLAILYIPAVTTIAESLRRRRHKPVRQEYQPSRIMPAFATAISRSRWFVLVVLVLVAGASLAAAANIRREAFGDPPRNWLPDDPLRQEHERAIAGFYETGTDDVKANILIFEGDVTDPALHRYIGAITGTLRQNALSGSWTDPVTNETHNRSRIIADTLKDLPFLLNTYLTVEGGVPGAGQFLGAGALATALERLNQTDPTGRSQTYPQTKEEIRQTLDDIHASPLYQFQNLFVDYPTYGMTVTIFSVEAATYADAEEVWNEVQAAVKANEALKPEGVQVSFFGNTAINYLFVAKQVPWLGYMSVVTGIAVIVIVFLFTRNVRTTLLTGACNLLSSTLWLGALTLPFIDIGLAISLTLPLVFIFAIGSDYGVHLALRCARSKDTYLTFEGVGKGVLYSFITTIGAFLVFTQISDLAGRRSMIATTIAIGVVFLMTLAIVPIFFPVKKHQRRGERDRNVPVVETRQITPSAPTPTGTLRPD